MDEATLNGAGVFYEVSANGWAVVILESGLLGLLGLLWRWRRQIVNRWLWWLKGLLVFVEVVEGLVELVLLGSLSVLVS